MDRSCHGCIRRSTGIGGKKSRGSMERFSMSVFLAKPHPGGFYLRRERLASV
jgi:hypothetical protein